MKLINYKKIQILDFFISFFRSAAEPIVQSLLMLIFIKIFNSSIVAKTGLVFCLKVGLISGIPISILIAKYKFRIHQSLAFVSLSMSGICLIIFFYHNLFVFYLLAFFISIFLNGLHPIHGELYNLYPKKSRAKKFITTLNGFALGSIFFTGIYELIIKEGIKNYSYIMLILFASSLILTFLYLLLPPIPYSKHSKIKPKTLFTILKKDKLFTYICISWFIMGTGNLWILPYRVNLLAEESFGFGYSESLILILIIIIPEIIRLLTTPFFAIVFDRYNFLVFRIMTNVLFIIYFIFFFFSGLLSNPLIGHLIGILFFGLATTSGSFAWKLWINRFTTKKKVPLYMTIHSGLTGIRILITPLLGLYALNKFGPMFCGGISILLLVIATLMIIRIYPLKNRFKN